MSHESGNIIISKASATTPVTSGGTCKVWHTWAIALAIGIAIGAFFF